MVVKGVNEQIIRTTFSEHYVLSEAEAALRRQIISHVREG